MQKGRPACRREKRRGGTTRPRRPGKVTGRVGEARGSPQARGDQGESRAESQATCEGPGGRAKKVESVPQRWGLGGLPSGRRCG